MKENLAKFAVRFNRNSVIRGIDLYQNDSVYDVRKVGNSYHFKVSGVTDNYETCISFNKNNQVEECYCSCMHYASGNLCKHLYASLLKLDDIFDGNDKSLIIENNQESISDNDLKSKETNKKDETLLDNIKMSNNDLATFRIYCNSYDADETSMNSFLDKFDLDAHQLATLFLMIRKPKAMEIFLNHYEEKLNSEFFKEIDLNSFPMSTPFKALVPFLFKHSNMLQYVNDMSLKELFSHHRISQLQDRITIFFLCLNLKQLRATILFFLDPENTLNFFQMNAFINYMKENMTIEQCLVALDIKIRQKTLTRMEAAFIYPYLKEETKKEYDEFFKNNYSAAIDNISYYAFPDYTYEYYYGYPLNRTFYNLLKGQTQMNNLTTYDLKIMFYLRAKLFSGENKLEFAKRFKLLAQSLFRSRNIDYEKIYCCLSIILEYGDQIEIIKMLEPRAIAYFSNIYNGYQCSHPEVYELFYKLTLKFKSIENVKISNYNQEV